MSLFLGSSYTWSVFSGPLCEKIGVEDLSIVFAVITAIGPIPMILGGKISERFGMKRVVLAGGLMYGAGLMLTGISDSTVEIVLSFSLLSGLGMCVVYGCLIGNAVAFFPDYRGMAGGVTTAAFGISSVILPPVAEALIRSMGVGTAFLLLGSVSAIVVTACAAVIIPCPYGFCPEGWKQENANDVTRIKDQTWHEMVHQPVFYIMLLMLTCGGTSGLMIISGASMMAQEMIGLTAAEAAVVVAGLSVCNAGGRLLSGVISDRLGRVRTLQGALLLALAGLFALSVSGNGAKSFFLMGIAFVGLCFGTFMGVFPGFTADRFGSKHSTMNYGFMWIGFAFAGIIGPMVLSSVYQMSGQYQAAFFTAAGIAVCGLILSAVYKKV